MDIIQRALERNYHISAKDELKNQTWAEFKKTGAGKKVFLFGLGAAGSYFILNYHKDVKLDGVIDSDRSKQGIHVGELVAEAMDTDYENIIISDISVLDRYKPEEVVVLVTSTTYYSAIIEQLEQVGITDYYVLLMMEANKRKEDAVTYVQDIEKIKLAYIEDCCNREIVKKKIVVSIGYYGGHGKYISEQLLKLDNSLDIVWVVKDLSLKCPKGVRLIYDANWKKYIYEMETAHIWVYDIALPAYIKKRAGQIYIQTKHWSSITLKKFFLDDASTTNTKEEIKRIQYNGAIMDYIFSGSKFDEETCKSGFAFKGKFVRVGSARTDALFRLENKWKVYKHYKLKENVHCALYAPTFRLIKEDRGKTFSLELDLQRVKMALERRFGGEWVILLRLHPSIAKESKKIAKDSFVVDSSDYDDSQELLAASDITISDYSSIMFEPAFLNKPVFLFAPDRQSYVNKERDLLIDYDKLPFPIAETNGELADSIIRFNQKQYEKDIQVFLDKYEVCEDGHASERAAKFILNLLESK